MIIINTSSTVVLHVWHYYSTYLLFFTAYNYDYYDNYYFNNNYNRVYITHHTNKDKNNISGNTVPILFLSHIFYFLVILLLRECSSCLFSLSFSCCNCYCCAVNIVFVINLMYVFCIHIFVQYAYFCSCLHWLFIYFVIYQSDSNLWWSLILYTASSQAAHHPHSVPFMVVLLLPATPTSSFVSPTPQFCDKELHPFYFLFINSLFFCFMVLTFCMQKDQTDTL